MRPFFAQISIQNPVHPEKEPLLLRCRVDASTPFFALPQHLAVSLWLPTADTRLLRDADGRQVLLPYAGPVRIGWNDRCCFAGALIRGTEAVLGAIPLADLGLELSSGGLSVPDAKERQGQDRA